MITQPENLTKDRLKSELKKHGVPFSQTQQKSYYVELYRERIMGGKVRSSPRKRSEFSSDEELFAKRRAAQVTPVRKRYTKAASPESYHAEVRNMSDGEMAQVLKQYGVDVGPITLSTREVYERKLAKLMSENVKAAKNKLISVVASESDEEFSSGSGGGVDEEVDVGGVEDYYQAQPKQRTDRTTPVKPEVQRGSHSYKPTPRPGIQQSQQRHQKSQQQQQVKSSKDRQTAKTQQSRPQTSMYASKTLNWLWWLLQSLLVVLVSFLVAFIVFDYIANRESRLVNWVFQSCPWIESLWYGADSSE